MKDYNAGENMINIFYHKKDLDGHCSGAIARYYWEIVKEEGVKMWPYDYGESFPFDKIEDGSRVVMVDVTTNPYEVMEEIKKRYDLFVIDHHKSFIESDVKPKITGLFVDGVAACQLAWHHFFMNDPTPSIVKLLGEYDIWNNQDQNVWWNQIMPIQMGMRMRLTDPGTDDGFVIWKKYFEDFLDKPDNRFPMMGRHYADLEDEVSKAGITILQYQEVEDKKAIDFYSFEARFGELKAVCLNNTRFNSQVYKSVWDNTKHDIMFAWVNVKGERCSVSLYTDKEGIDVSKIAKEYGGGGHKQAAGFQCREVKVVTHRNNEKIIILIV